MAGILRIELRIAESKSAGLPFAYIPLMQSEGGLCSKKNDTIILEKISRNG